jgi:predicted proteasome-type protease
MPLDLLIYRHDDLEVTSHRVIDENNAYYTQLRKLWGTRLREAFAELPVPDWDRMTSPVPLRQSPDHPAAEPEAIAKT